MERCDTFEAPAQRYAFLAAHKAHGEVLLLVCTVGQVRLAAEKNEVKRKRNCYWDKSSPDFDLVQVSEKRFALFCKAYNRFYRDRLRIARKTLLERTRIVRCGCGSPANPRRFFTYPEIARGARKPWIGTGVASDLWAVAGILESLFARHCRVGFGNKLIMLE